MIPCRRDPDRATVAVGIAIGIGIEQDGRHSRFGVPKRGDCRTKAAFVCSITKFGTGPYRSPKGTRKGQREQWDHPVIWTQVAADQRVSM